MTPWPPAKRSTGATMSVLSMLAACAVPPAPPTDWDWHASASAAELDGFDGHTDLLDGFDTPRPGTLVRTGDCALFGLCLLDGERRREWYLRLTALDDEQITDRRKVKVPANSQIARWFDSSSDATPDADGNIEVDLPWPHDMRVEVFDGKRKRLADERHVFSPSLFDGALLGCLEATMVPPPPARSLFEPPTHESRAVYSVMNVMGIVRGAKSLLAILREVAQLPPLWTLLRGLRVGTGMSLERAVPEPTTDGSIAFAFPLRVVINGNPALLCTVTAVDPMPPLRVCGGFTRVVAQDPANADRRVVLTLLAARCSE